jgi:endonuclease/exonuclease/phosphatase family metal-dependent hydrolase
MELTLVTCNIRFDNPADGANAWTHRRLFLKDLLLSHSPDVIATQEGRFGQLQDLHSLLPEYEIVDQHRAWIGERMYPTFFVKKKRFELTKSEDIWLSETPDVAGSKSFGSAFPRLMTWMKLQPIGSQNDLWFVNTHLDHIKEETRLGQVNVLMNQVKRFWNPSDKLFVMGDFNDSPLSSVRAQLMNTLPLQDAWKIFHSKEETSHHAFAGEEPNGNRIDWILADNRAKVLSSELDKTSRNGKYPTDHFPVVAKISL